MGGTSPIPSLAMGTQALRLLNKTCNNAKHEWAGDLHKGEGLLHRHHDRTSAE